MINTNLFLSNAPAPHFPSSNHPFRVKAGKGRADAAPPTFQSFSRSVSALRAKKWNGGRSSGSSSKRLNQGRGATGSVKGFVRKQRVIVKARVVKNGLKSKAKAALKKHIDYLQRDNVSDEGEKGKAFNLEGELNQEQINAIIDKATDDRHHFRLIISPEKASDLNLEDYARDFITQTEQDLGTKLEWVGVAHFNTDNPHVHLFIRGIDERGADLVINRDYISHGFRETAQDIATRYLGQRLESDIEQERLQNITADRFTLIDRKLIEASKNHESGFVNTRAPIEESERSLKQRLQTIGRLQYLEGLSFAEEIHPGQWQLVDDFESKLRDYGFRRDVIKNIHKKLGDKAKIKDVILYNKETSPGITISGEIIDKGSVDEISDRQYVIVNGADGNAYYIGLSRFSEQSGIESRRGSIVNIKTVERPVVSRADHNIVNFAAGNGGIYDAQKHRDKAIRENKIPAHVDPNDYMEAHIKRADGHARRALIESVDTGQYKVSPNLINVLETVSNKGRDNGSFVEVKRQSRLDLRQQMSAIGPTWLDEKIKAGEHLNKVSLISESKFQKRVRAALRGRLFTLKQRGLVSTVDGEARLKNLAFQEMYEQEITHKIKAYRGRYGEAKKLSELGSFTGKVERIEELSNGPHALIVSDKEFVLIPAKSGLYKQLGNRVEVATPVKNIKTNAISDQMKMRVSFKSLDAPSRQKNIDRSK